MDCTFTANEKIPHFFFQKKEKCLSEKGSIRSKLLRDFDQNLMILVVSIEFFRPILNNKDLSH